LGTLEIHRQVRNGPFVSGDHWTLCLGPKDIRSLKLSFL
jgi:hypothetical protein